MNAEVSWLYELTVKPGQVGSFRTLMAELVDSAHAESGTFLYEWSLSDDGSVAHIREGYADSASALSHLARFRETFAERFRSAVEPTGWSCTAVRATRSRTRWRRSGPPT